ncbi:MAG: DUF3040 domain-containing protein [Bifidobacteriaceae bacterium]|jgi:hypothetical protein|nr:DUF3040 domain-containing protein [Bifidobacteriaceae bacterium]
MPLSEYEQRVLDQLEAQLAHEDPELGSRMVAVGARRRGRVALGVAGVVFGLVILVTGVAVGQVWVSLIGFLIMFGGAYFAVSKPKAKGLADAMPRRRGPKSGKSGKSGKAGGKTGLSDKFLRRIDGDGAV